LLRGERDLILETVNWQYLLSTQPTRDKLKYQSAQRLFICDFSYWFNVLL